MGALSLRGTKAPSSSPEQPLSKVILKLVLSFLLQVGTCREILGLFVCGLLVISRSGEWLYDFWNTRPSCVFIRSLCKSRISVYML